MKYRFTIFTVAFIALFSFNACTSESGNTKAIEANDLVGTWECVAGELNGTKDAPFAKNETSPGAMITFSKDIMSFPNLADFDKSKEQPYNLEGEKIVFPNDKDLVFDVLEYKQDTIVLEFALDQYLMKMTMERK